jgi:hypothetical protein
MQAILLQSAQAIERQILFSPHGDINIFSFILPAA